MALINLQSNLKSLTYGEFGGGVTGTRDPLVTKSINNPQDLNAITLQTTKRTDDLKRVTKLLTQTPAAIYFGAHQASLNTLEQRIKSNKKGKLAGDIIRGIGNTVKVLASTLAQVPVSGTGTHFVKGFAGKMGYLPEVRGHVEYNNEVPDSLYQDGTNKITVEGKVEETGNTDKKGVVLKTYVDKFTQTLDTPFVADTSTIIATQPGSINSDEQRNKLTKGDKYTLKFVPRGRGTTTKFDRTDQGFESDTPIITVGKSSTGNKVADVFTALRPITGSVSDAPGVFTPTDEFNTPLIEKDLIDFNFKIIEPIRGNEDSPKLTYIPFRAYLDSFDDDYKSTWNSFKYVGRAEDLYTYGGFNRSIGFGFKVAASSKAEMTPLYEKLNLLAGSTAPSYVGSGFMRGQFVAVTVGDYLINQTGIIESINFSWKTDYIWHSNGMNSFNEASDNLEQGKEPPSAKNLPTTLDVQVSFTPVHTMTPKYGAEFIGRNNKIFYTKY